MKKKIINFCVLCHRPVAIERSVNFCSQHLPDTFLYRRDRCELVSKCQERYNDTLGKQEKLSLLSQTLDSFSFDSDLLYYQAKKRVINGILNFKEAIKLVSDKYKHTEEFLTAEPCYNEFFRRWFRSYLRAIGYTVEQVSLALEDKKDEEIFESMLLISARFNSYKEIDNQFIDGRGRPRLNIENLNGIKKESIISIVNSEPRKPNGKVSRSSIAKRLGISRFRVGRIIKKLKEHGDLNGDI